MQQPLRALAALTVGFALGVGCGTSDKTEVIGQVMLNGQPIDDGDISFYPEPGTAGAQSSAPIKSGKYYLGGEWGLVAGSYQVRIHAYRAPSDQSKMLAGGLLDKPPETPGIPSREQFLPKKFNTESTIEKLTVASGKKKVEQNYDLKD